MTASAKKENAVYGPGFPTSEAGGPVRHCAGNAPCASRSHGPALIASQRPLPGGIALAVGILNGGSGPRGRGHSLDTIEALTHRAESNV